MNSILLAIVLSPPMTRQVTWYGWESGPLTASGQKYNPNAMCGASRDLFGKTLRLTYRGKSVTVRINDKTAKRLAGLVVDLTPAAFRRLAPLKAGRLHEVQVEVIKYNFILLQSNKHPPLRGRAYKGTEQ